MRQGEGATVSAADTRGRIIEAARAVFVEGGGVMEMNAVAGRAGVSVGLAYHYFGSKAGLITALVEDFYDAYDEVVNRKLPDAMPWSEREFLRLRGAVAFLFQDPVALIVLGRLGGSPEIVAAELRHREAIIKLGAVNIQKGCERGELAPVADPQLASEMINGGIRQAITRALAEPEGVDIDALSRNLWKPVCAILGLPQPA